LVLKNTDEFLQLERLRNRKYHALNKEKISERKRRYYKRDPAKVCINKKNYRDKLKNRLYSILGGSKCVRCGFSDVRALQFDHIKGGGRKDLLRFTNSCQMHLFYSNNPDEAKETLQVLCANCNWIKKNENKEFHRPVKYLN